MKRESTMQKERVKQRKRATTQERAKYAESTITPERAIVDESSIHRERASSRESTNTSERATRAESTMQSERPVWIRTVDNLLNAKAQKTVLDFLEAPGWKSGWKSRADSHYEYGFFHKHFAGAEHPDHTEEGRKQQYDCADELAKRVPLLSNFWRFLNQTQLRGHTLVRCYANGMPYGSDGSVHTDSVSPNSWTCVYYAHERWSPNWAGELVFFNKEETEIAGAVYPKPNRLVCFRGIVPHVARSVSRICPNMRISLMFKTLGSQQ